MAGAQGDLRIRFLGPGFRACQNRAGATPRGKRCRCVLAALVVACRGDGNPPATVESAGSVAEVEAAVDHLLVRAPDRGEMCQVLSPRQLKESFGGDVRRCEAAVERRSGTGIETYEVAEVGDGCARVEAVDQDQQEAVLFLREIDGRWLVNDIEEPPLSDSVDPVCGGVRLFAR